MVTQISIETGSIKGICKDNDFNYWCAGGSILEVHIILQPLKEVKLSCHVQGFAYNGKNRIKSNNAQLYSA